MTDEKKYEEKYICLINNESQYSIWFEWKEIPLGWNQVGCVGTKEECLAYIKENWTDMRPKSLQEAMDKKALS